MSFNESMAYTDLHHLTYCSSLVFVFRDLGNAFSKRNSIKLRKWDFWF